MSLRDYAKRRGVSAMAVSKAISSGRLVASVTRVDGQPKIRDADLADQEWDRATDLSKAPGYVKERASSRAAQPAAAPPPPRQPRTGEAQLPDNLSLGEESAREKFWKAQIAELDYRERLGALVDAKEMNDKLVDVFTRCRTRLLGLPTRSKQQLPHLSVTDIGTLDSLVREALDELALELEAEEAQAAEAVNG